MVDMTKTVSMLRLLYAIWTIQKNINRNKSYVDSDSTMLDYCRIQIIVRFNPIYYFWFKWIIWINENDTFLLQISNNRMYLSQSIVIKFNNNSTKIWKHTSK